jgi:succinate-semialdehyde dehydrogenase/glutarate-semialdehyde dehydrogenase
MQNLKDKALFRQQGFVNGEWRDARSAQTLAVVDPASGETIGSVPDFDADDTREAIDAAHRALPAWAALSAHARAGILRKWRDLMVHHADDLAYLMTLEQGKPLSEARGEILYGASFVEWFAEEGIRAYGEMIPAPTSSRRILVRKIPVGVAAAITPWNFPNAMITRKLAPALAAGCTAVVKPSELPGPGRTRNARRHSGRRPQYRDGPTHGHWRRTDRQPKGTEADFHGFYQGRQAPAQALR